MLWARETDTYAQRVSHEGWKGGWRTFLRLKIIKSWWFQIRQQGTPFALTHKYARWQSDTYSHPHTQSQIHAPYHTHKQLVPKSKSCANVLLWETSPSQGFSRFTAPKYELRTELRLSAKSNLFLKALPGFAEETWTFSFPFVTSQRKLKILRCIACIFFPCLLFLALSRPPPLVPHPLPPSPSHSLTLHFPDSRDLDFTRYDGQAIFSGRTNLMSSRQQNCCLFMYHSVGASFQRFSLAQKKGFCIFGQNHPLDESLRPNHSHFDTIPTITPSREVFLLSSTKH